MRNILGLRTGGGRCRAETVLGLLGLLVLSIGGSPDPARASGNDAAAREIEQLVRSAEKDVKGGAITEAGEKLDRATEMLSELEAAEPRHRAVRPLKARLAAALKSRDAALAAGPADTKAVEAAADATAIAQADAQLMIDLYDRYYPRLDPIHGNSLVYGVKESDARSALDQIEAVEALLPEFSSELGRLADTYGTEPLEIGKNLRSRGVKISGDPGGRLAYLIEATGKVGKSREASAASCAQNAEILMGSHSGPVTDARIRRMSEVKKLLVIGQKLDPNNEDVREKLARIDDQIAEAAETMEAEIDAATWAGNAAGFPGPGDAGALARDALGFFRNHDGWGKRPDKKIDVLNACVRGPWQVAERDLFGRVISWRLPIHVAVTDPDLRPRNIARVYELSILAMEGPPDRAPKAPPFAGYWVGNSWMMRLDKF